MTVLYEDSGLSAVFWGGLMCLERVRAQEPSSYPLSLTLSSGVTSVGVTRGGN